MVVLESLIRQYQRRSLLRAKSHYAFVLNSVLFLGMAACGGKGTGVTTPSPSVNPTPPPPVAKAVLVETVKDEMEDPVEGAQFAVNGQAVGTTGSDGRLVMSVKAGDALTVTSTCLQFDTIWREATSPTFRLNCMEATFVREILYGGQDEPDDARLRLLARPKPDVPGGAATMNIRVESAHDYFSPDVLPEAVNKSNVFTRGITNFAVGVGKVIVHYRIDPADPYFAPGAEGAGAAAYNQSRYENGWIVESKVVVKDFLTTDGETLYTRAQAIRMFVHENGHALGLRHHHRIGIMEGTNKFRVEAPSGDETRAAVFATNRPSGTKWIDNQTATTGAGRGRNGWGPREACAKAPPSLAR